PTLGFVCETRDRRLAVEHDRVVPQRHADRRDHRSEQRRPCDDSFGGAAARPRTPSRSLLSHPRSPSVPESRPRFAARGRKVWDAWTRRHPSSGNKQRRLLGRKELAAQGKLRSPVPSRDVQRVQPSELHRGGQQPCARQQHSRRKLWSADKLELWTARWRSRSARDPVWTEVQLLRMCGGGESQTEIL